jgi:hypothetical protein
MLLSGGLLVLRHLSMGEWINDFQHLKKAIQENDKLREQKEAEDPKKIQKLKDDFGIG